MAKPVLLYQNVLVEFLVGGSNKIFLPDQPNLRGAKIVGIEANDNNILPVCSDLLTPNVPLATFRQSFLTLVSENVNAIERIPLQNFQTNFDNSNAAPTGRANMAYRDMENMLIYFNKSYIEFPAAVAPGINCAFNLGVYYYDPNKGRA